ncbi:unnamed protein product [Cochlearia groenlandica]
MGFVLTATCPRPSLFLVSQLHQFPAGIKISESQFCNQLNQTRGTLISKSKQSCFNLPQEPILSDALKEPIAFMGGMFAGLLRLDLNEEPLKEWVTRTVEASGIITEDGGDGIVSNQEEESPQQIDIE